MSDVDKITFITSYDKEHNVFCLDVRYNHTDSVVKLGLSGKILLEMLLELGSVVKDRKTKSVTLTFNKETNN